MEPGLGTNPGPWGERCRPDRAEPFPDVPGCRVATSEEERAKSEVSQWRPAGYGSVADATDPYLTSRIPTPQGGWVGFLRAPEKEWGWGLS
jgi:hypothetical protein